MNRRMICVNCPRGCHLTVEQNGDSAPRVSGNRCPRGTRYALGELTDPRRTVTAVVPTSFPEMPCLPVRTSRPLPVKLIPKLLNRLYKMKVSTHTTCGEVLISDFDGSGVDVIFTADSPENV